MIRFAALNESDDSGEEESDREDEPSTTKEAEESEAFAAYNRALGLQRAGNEKGAEAVFCDLLQHPFIVKARRLLDAGTDDCHHPALPLLYLVHKNMATSAIAKGNLIDGMKSYLQAVRIDGSEVTVWYKMGTVAKRLHNYPLAKLAFEQGLQCNERHWPCLDAVITVLYALNNYDVCLEYCARGLERDPYYTKALVFWRQILKEQPSLSSHTKELFVYCDPIIHTVAVDPEEAKTMVQECIAIRDKRRELVVKPEPPSLTLRKPISELTWRCVGECLVELFDDFISSNPPKSLVLPLDMKEYVAMAEGKEDHPQQTLTPTPTPSSHTTTVSSSANIKTNEPEMMEVDAQVPATNTDSSQPTATTITITTLPPVGPNSRAIVDPQTGGAQGEQAKEADEVSGVVKLEEKDSDLATSTTMEATDSTKDSRSVTAAAAMEVEDSTAKLTSSGEPIKVEGEKETMSEMMVGDGERGKKEGEMDGVVKEEGNANENEKAKGDGEAVADDKTVVEKSLTAEEGILAVEVAAPSPSASAANPEQKPFPSQEDDADNSSVAEPSTTLPQQSTSPVSARSGPAQVSEGVSSSNKGKGSEETDDVCHSPMEVSSPGKEGSSSPSSSVTPVTSGTSSEPTKSCAQVKDVSAEGEGKEDASAAASAGSAVTAATDSSSPPLPATTGLPPGEKGSKEEKEGQEPQGQTTPPPQELVDVKKEELLSSAAITEVTTTMMSLSVFSSSATTTTTITTTAATAPHHQSGGVGASEGGGRGSSGVSDGGGGINDVSVAVGEGGGDYGVSGGGDSKTAVTVECVNGGGEGTPTAGVASAAPSSSSLLLTPVTITTTTTTPTITSQPPPSQSSPSPSAVKAIPSTPPHPPTTTTTTTTPPSSSQSRPHSHSPSQPKYQFNTITPGEVTALLQDCVPSTPLLSTPAPSSYSSSLVERFKQTTAAAAAAASASLLLVPSSTLSSLMSSGSGGGGVDVVAGSTGVVTSTATNGGAVERMDVSAAAVSPVSKQHDSQAPVSSVASTVAAATPVSVEEALQDHIGLGRGSKGAARRGTKRKRAPVEPRRRILGPEDYGIKRRSARVRNTRKEEENVDIQKQLYNFLPTSLTDPDQQEEESQVEDVTAAQSVSDVTTAELCGGPPLEETEAEDVRKYLKECLKRQGVVGLMYKYLLYLSSRDTRIWPAGVTDLYLQVYKRVRDHLTFPSLYYMDFPEVCYTELSKMALVWGELLLDSFLVKHADTISPHHGHREAGPTKSGLFTGPEAEEDLFYLKRMVESDFIDLWADSQTAFTARVYWMLGRLALADNHMDKAQDTLEMVADSLRGDDGVSKVYLPNCQRDNLITVEEVKRQQESLKRCQSLEESQRLFDDSHYTQVIDSLTATCVLPNATHQTFKPALPERQSQLELLQDALYQLEDWGRCLLWGEVVLHEALHHYRRAPTLPARDTWATTLVHLLEGLQRVLDRESNAMQLLPTRSLMRLAQSLIRIVEINHDVSENVTDMPITSVLPWMLLYRIIRQEEDKKPATPTPTPSAAAATVTAACDEDDEEDDEDADSPSSTSSSSRPSIPASLQLLSVAHEYLGRNSWCTREEGIFLLFYMDVLTTEIARVANLTPRAPKALRDELDSAFEQCVFCLYGHPNKKGRMRNLVDHSAPCIELMWEHCEAVFEYFKPKTLPEFDSYKTSTVSGELHNLLRRIYALIPDTDDISPRLSQVQSYVEGTTSTPPNFSTSCIILQELYYLLADYYFKNKEQTKAIKFYMYDVCFNSERFDSWAGLALAKMLQLEQRLNSMELKIDSPVHRKSIQALRCFSRAVEVDEGCRKLWIEYGSLAYQLHSHASRQLRMKLWFPLTSDLKDIAMETRVEMLSTARNCYWKASECESEGREEEWLHHYMMGKVREKQRQHPRLYLEHYKQAAIYLHEEEAKYPRKILYHSSPPYLSLEALEMYYRLHVAVMKHLLRVAAPETREDMALFDRYLSEATQSPFALRKEKHHDTQDSVSSADDSQGSEVAVLPYSTSHQKPVYHMTPQDHTYSKQKSSGGETSDASCNEAKDTTTGTETDGSQSSQEETDGMTRDSGAGGGPRTSQQSRGKRDSTDVVELHAETDSQVSSQLHDTKPLFYDKQMSGGFIPQLGSDHSQMDTHPSSTITTTTTSNNNTNADTTTTTTSPASGNGPETAKTEGGMEELASSLQREQRPPTILLIDKVNGDHVPMETDEEGRRDNKDQRENKGQTVETALQKPDDKGPPPTGKDNQGNKDASFTSTTGSDSSVVIISSSSADDSLVSQGSSHSQLSQDLDPVEPSPQKRPITMVAQAQAQSDLEPCKRPRILTSQVENNDGNVEEGVGASQELCQSGDRDDLGLEVCTESDSESFFFSESALELLAEKSMVDDEGRENIATAAAATVTKRGHREEVSESAMAVQGASLTQSTGTQLAGQGGQEVIDVSAQGDEEGMEVTEQQPEVKTECTTGGEEEKKEDMEEKKPSDGVDKSVKTPTTQPASVAASSAISAPLVVKSEPQDVDMKDPDTSSAASEHPASASEPRAGVADPSSEAHRPHHTTFQKSVSPEEASVKSSSSPSLPSLITQAVTTATTSINSEQVKDGKGEVASNTNTSALSQEVKEEEKPALEGQPPSSASKSGQAEIKDTVSSSQKSEDQVTAPTVAAEGTAEDEKPSISDSQGEQERLTLASPASTSHEKDVQAAKTPEEKPPPVFADQTISAASEQKQSSSNEEASEKETAANGDASKKDSSTNGETSKKESTSSTSIQKETSSSKETSSTTVQQQKESSLSDANAKSQQQKELSSTSTTTTNSQKEPAKTQQQEDSTASTTTTTTTTTSTPTTTTTTQPPQQSPGGNNAEEEEGPPPVLLEVGEFRAWKGKLLDKCVDGLHLCLTRFPTHYKSLYRLAYLYYASDTHRNLHLARDLLLGNGSWATLKHMPANGLFSDRKTNNFFNGMWKIPIDEIDRSGSFASHVNRSVQLLLEVLRDLGDVHTLLTVHTQLKRKPLDQARKYLRDGERHILAQMAHSYTLDAVASQMCRAQGEVDGTELLLSAFKAYNAHRYSSEAQRAMMLLVAAHHRLGLPKHGYSTPLEQAVQYCNTIIASQSMSQRAHHHQSHHSSSSTPSPSVSTSHRTVDTGIGTTPTPAFTPTSHHNPRPHLPHHSFAHTHHQGMGSGSGSHNSSAAQTSSVRGGAGGFSGGSQPQALSRPRPQSPLYQHPQQQQQHQRQGRPRTLSESGSDAIANTGKHHQHHGGISPTGLSRQQHHHSMMSSALDLNMNPPTSVHHRSPTTARPQASFHSPPRASIPSPGRVGAATGERGEVEVIDLTTSPDKAPSSMRMSSSTHHHQRMASPQRMASSSPYHRITSPPSQRRGLGVGRMTTAGWGRGGIAGVRSPPPPSRHQQQQHSPSSSFRMRPPGMQGSSSSVRGSSRGGSMMGSSVSNRRGSLMGGLGSVRGGLGMGSRGGSTMGNPSNIRGGLSTATPGSRAGPTSSTPTPPHLRAPPTPYPSPLQGASVESSRPILSPNDPSLVFTSPSPSSSSTASRASLDRNLDQGDLASPSPRKLTSDMKHHFHGDIS